MSCAWRVLGVCLACAWRVLGVCLSGAWRVLEWCLACAWVAAGEQRTTTPDPSLTTLLTKFSHTFDPSQREDSVDIYMYLRVNHAIFELPASNPNIVFFAY